LYMGVQTTLPRAGRIDLRIYQVDELRRLCAFSGKLCAKEVLGAGNWMKIALIRGLRFCTET
jgi:hypothetical protein